MRYSPVFVEQIVQFAFSNVEREIADENGRHDVVVVDVDVDAELPNWGSRAPSPSSSFARKGFVAKYVRALCAL